MSLSLAALQMCLISCGNSLISCLVVSLCDSLALYGSACISANPQRTALLQTQFSWSAFVRVLDLWVFEQPKRVKFFINGQNFENLALRAGNSWFWDFRWIGLWQLQTIYSFLCPAWFCWNCKASSLIS